MGDLHPLVTVVDHADPMGTDLNHSRLNYGLYALFLKQGDGCSIRYGREIANQLGFEYPQHFSRLFKSRTGMTPNEPFVL